MKKYVFTLFVFAFVSLTAYAVAGVWGYGVNTSSLIAPGTLSVQIQPGTSVAQQQSIASSHGYPLAYIMSPGTSCAQVGNFHRYYTVTWIKQNGHVRMGVIRFYTQTCGF